MTSLLCGCQVLGNYLTWFFLITLLSDALGWSFAHLFSPASLYHYFLVSKFNNGISLYPSHLDTLSLFGGKNNFLIIYLTMGHITITFAHDDINWGTFFACSIIKDLFEIPYVINWNKPGKLQKKEKKNKKKDRNCLSQCWGPQLTTSRWSVNAWWVKRPPILTC